jgi:hypothetical protein
MGLIFIIRFPGCYSANLTICSAFVFFSIPLRDSLLKKAKNLSCAGGATL